MDPELRAYLDQRFEAIDGRFEAIDRRFEGIDRRLDGIDRRFERSDRHFEAMEGRFEAVEGRFEAVGGRFAAIEQQVRRNGVLLDAVRADVRTLGEGHQVLLQGLERGRQENEQAHREILALLRVSFRDLDRRVTRLESGPGGGPA